MPQDQFLNVIDRDEAERRFRAALDLRRSTPRRSRSADALGRVLAEDVVAPVDVPGFDRSNVDGFAVRAEDTFGAARTGRARCASTGEVLAAGVVPRTPSRPGHGHGHRHRRRCCPRGADAVVMVEHTDVRGGELLVRRPVTPGANVTFAGTDIGRGETVLRRGDAARPRARPACWPRSAWPRCRWCAGRASPSSRPATS